MALKKIWIDLDNLPHVLIFRYLIDKLSKEYDVIVTARDHAFTCELLDRFQIPHIKVGRYPGKHVIKKIVGTLWRAFQLFVKMMFKHPSLAVCHGSRSLVIAAWVLRVPVITMFDYEYVHGRLFEWFSRAILIPQAVKAKHPFSENDKYIAYPGFKEMLYLPFFQPDEDFPERIGLDRQKINVILRPPASTAHYHNPLAEQLFDEILSILTKKDDIRAILIPRLKDQVEIYIKKEFPNISILDKPVNGLDLIYYSDLVIGGGGTMNREAALMGVPVYSIFQGERGVLDAELERQGRLTFIQSHEDIALIRWKKKKLTDNGKPDQTTFEFVLRIITQMADKRNILGYKV